ncbi:hypothetical protein MGSAQ_002466 [marine sediment metagenome]|uniref:Uncharacterized protein n=1 Tax=marine sediment metagenome TaxID=412755 RepID=A0A1B6NRF6_9ZZZZ
MLEDSLVGAVSQISQLWAQGDVIARQPLAGVALGDAVD